MSAFTYVNAEGASVSFDNNNIANNKIISLTINTELTDTADIIHYGVYPSNDVVAKIKKVTGSIEYYLEAGEMILADGTEYSFELNHPSANVSITGDVLVTSSSFVFGTDNAANQGTIEFTFQGAMTVNSASNVA